MPGAGFAHIAFTSTPCLHQESFSCRIAKCRADIAPTSASSPTCAGRA